MIKWLCHVMEKYGSLIEGAMAGANMRMELDIIEEVELLLCPTWVGGEGLKGWGLKLLAFFLCEFECLFIVLRIFLLYAENKKVGEDLNKRKANQSYMIFFCRN